MTREIILYDYPKSSASYRVRIALNLLGLDYQIETVNLLDGSHRAPEHLARNPQGLVPALWIDGVMLTQSLAILDYLSNTTELSLLPDDAMARARISAAAMAIVVDLHPVCNLSVMLHATGGKEPAKTQWMQHFIRPGLLAFEAMIAAPNFKIDSGHFCAGSGPSLADICLIPQLYNAKRWGVDYSDCPHICTAEATCAVLPAFVDAHPDNG